MLFAVKNIALQVPYDTAYNYLTDISKLPEWTNAFAEVYDDGTALMRTPAGEVRVTLEGRSNREHGTIDTRMIFPDNSEGMAYSRLIELAQGSCAYSFVLPAPPGPLEQIEGDLEQQASVVERELAVLKSKLEA